MAMKEKVFFHGTSKRNARKILREGFRDWSWTAETPLVKYKAKSGIDRWIHDGSYGRGTYVTCNWRSALFFGPVLFRVELQSGTRIVRIDLPPEGKVLDSLKREFGTEILSKSPWKVMPTNKRLTLDEAIQLARHHVRQFEGSGWNDPRVRKHEKLMFDMRNILVRYGVQGWGEPSEIGGIVIFATDRLKVREVALSLPSKDLLRSFNDTRTVADRCASLDALTRTCLTARNRGAANTFRWVEKSNQELVRRFH
jgi:hypothetical protein